MKQLFKFINKKVDKISKASKDCVNYFSSDNMKDFMLCNYLALEKEF